MLAMDENDSFERALADIELLQAAFPDEIDAPEDVTQFPLHLKLRLDDAFIVLEFVDGYPVSTGVRIHSYRATQKARIDAATRALRHAASECLEDEIEGGMMCCSAAMETWNNFQETAKIEEKEKISPQVTASPVSLRQYDWISGEPIVDRKSSFIAHACRVSSEAEVYEALQQLLSSSSKIQRATHNMSAWRLTEVLKNGQSVKKFDNDDDGEDAAGSRLAQLLEHRDEDGVLVVVSRWYGGILLGPKRFAHITNAARKLLVHCHETVWKGK